MPYEFNTFLGVSQHYGPRLVEGVEGVTKTEGVLNEFIKDMDNDGLDFGFPPGAVGQSVWVVSCDTTLVEGTLSGVETIGGVDISGATLEAPVEITPENTREVVIGGATGGTLLIRFKKYPPV